MNPKKPRKKCLNCGKECNRIKAIYCSVECRDDYNYGRYIKEWLKGENNGSRKGGKDGLLPSKRIRRYLLEQTKGICEKCGWDKKHIITGKPLVQLHHIDGNLANNSRENLEILCPNCHSSTKTWGNYGRYKNKQ